MTPALRPEPPVYRPIDIHADAMRAIIQGMLYGVSSRDVATNDALRQPVEVEQTVDDKGIYNPWFTFVLASGIRIKVEVSVDEGV